LDSLDRLWERAASSERSAGRGWVFRVSVILAVLLVLFIVFNVLKGFYTEWLWFDSLDYGSVYATILKTKVLLFFSAAIIFGVLFMGNLMLATRLAPRNESRIWPWALVRQLQRLSMWSTILGTVLVSLIFGSVAQSGWQLVLRFFNAQPFGIADPVFHKDISFYVFSLPFQHLLHGWLMGALIVILIGSGGIYFLSYATQRLRFDFARPVLAHLSGLTAAILGLFVWGYWLGIWELVFSEIVVGGIFPALVQRFQVQPNELVREEPYIEYNIRFTREAFALDRIKEQSFPAEKTPSSQDIADNEATINNIRLWDHRPLKDTYNQIQSIRLYYDFHDVDVDRYTIDGDYRQVMLAARELSVEKLAGQAQTWVNRQLFYTHGYGVALSPVNEVSSEGLPNLMIKDIPPVGIFNIEQPQIYFGEKTDHYVIVKTETEEFDYPVGDKNAFHHYAGQGGVSLKGFIRRLAYAWQFGDFNILISGQLTPESRVLYYRDISERVSHLAPFLRLDSDPYLVVVDGERG